MPLTALIAHGATLALTLAMLRVMVTDATRFTITNQLNISIAVLWGVTAFFLPVDPYGALMASALMLGVGLILFYTNLMGGGDVKLLTVLILWTGWGKASLTFLFTMGMVGGVIVLVLLVLRGMIPRIALRLCPTRNVPRVFSPGEPVPYGLAIAGAFLWMLWEGLVPALPALRHMI